MDIYMITILETCLKPNYKEWKPLKYTVYIELGLSLKPNYKEWKLQK